MSEHHLRFHMTAALGLAYPSALVAPAVPEGEPLPNVQVLKVIRTSDIEIVCSRFKEELSTSLLRQRYPILCSDRTHTAEPRITFRSFEPQGQDRSRSALEPDHKIVCFVGTMGITDWVSAAEFSAFIHSFHSNAVYRAVTNRSVLSRKPIPLVTGGIMRVLSDEQVRNHCQPQVWDRSRRRWETLTWKEVRKRRTRAASEAA